MDHETHADPSSEWPDERRIVVGVEGPESKAALTWAIEEAFRRDATVEAVMVWSDPYATKNWTAPMSATTQSRSIPANRSSQLSGLVEEATRRYPGARVEAFLRDGRTASTLLRAAEGADLLVIGSATNTGVASVMSRSVGRQLLSHPPCPVVIVPASVARRSRPAARTVTGTEP